MRLTPNTATPEAIINDITAVIPADEGAGFWDRGYDEYTDEHGNHTDVSDAANSYESDGDYLTEMTKPFGSAAVFFTRDEDDNITQLYFEG
jgi:hypothetical protein